MRFTAPPARSAVRTIPQWPRLRPSRRALLGLILLLSLAGVALSLASALMASAHAQVNQAGADDARMQAAVQAAQWPQTNGNWCGIADIAAIASYQNGATSQAAIATYLNSGSSQSAWGTPAPNSNIAWGPGFLADISRDGGTDPRSMAAGLTHFANGSYHQWVDYHSAYNATAHIVADLVRTQEPITVFVNAGSHSVLVSAVRYNGSDPTNLNNVTALEIWDSGVGPINVGVQSSQVEWVSLNTWLWRYAYLGSTYQPNIYDGRHALDPDPSVGPYTYDPSQGRYVHLWIGHYVYIHPDSPSEPAHGVSPDWAFNQDGALIRGLNGEVPAGYGGPSVPMYIPPPPTPTPPPTATPTATPPPTRTPHPSRATEPDFSNTPVAGTPSPAGGSLFGFSVGSICVGSPCTGADAMPALALGGASSLGMTVLLVVGVVTVRRRKRRILAGQPQSATSPPERAQPENKAESEAESGAGALPADAAAAADDVMPPAQIDPAPTSDEGDPSGQASGDVSPLALLAHASDRLERLTVESEAPLAGAADASIATDVPASADASRESTQETMQEATHGAPWSTPASALEIRDAGESTGEEMSVWKEMAAPAEADAMQADAAEAGDTTSTALAALMGEAAPAAEIAPYIEAAPYADVNFATAAEMLRAHEEHGDEDGAAGVDHSGSVDEPTT